MKDFPLLRVKNLREVDDSEKRNILEHYSKTHKPLYIREEDSNYKHFFQPILVKEIIDEYTYFSENIPFQKEEQKRYFHDISEILEICPLHD